MKTILIISALLALALAVALSAELPAWDSNKLDGPEATLFPDGSVEAAIPKPPPEGTTFYVGVHSGRIREVRPF